MFNGNFYGLPRNEAWDPLQVFQKVNCLGILASAEHLNKPVIQAIWQLSLCAPNLNHQQQKKSISMTQDADNMKHTSLEYRRTRKCMEMTLAYHLTELNFSTHSRVLKRVPLCFWTRLTVKMGIAREEWGHIDLLFRSIEVNNWTRVSMPYLTSQRMPEKNPSRKDFRINPINQSQKDNREAGRTNFRILSSSKPF